MAKKIKIDRELYDKFTDAMSNQRIIDKLIEENKELKNIVHEYMKLYMDTNHEKAELLKRNEALEVLFDKKQDTQAIKYQGNIYRIVNTTHYSGVGERDILQIEATDYGEVNEDG